MVQFLSIIFFLGFLQFLLGFSKVPVFFVSLCILTCINYGIYVAQYMRKLKQMVREMK